MAHSPLVRYRFRAVRVVAVAIAILVSEGCATWKGISRDEMVQTVPRERPAVIRVVQNGSVFQVRTPRIDGDSLRGTVHSDRVSRAVAFDLSSIDGIQVPRPNHTPVRIVAASLVGLSIIWLIAIDQPKRVP
jgi:hypothetical protein